MTLNELFPEFGCSWVDVFSMHFLKFGMYVYVKMYEIAFF